MWDRFLDHSVLFSFDKSGFVRHAYGFNFEHYHIPKGKRALITGGTSGIGLSVAKTLAAFGIHVYLMTRHLAKAHDAKIEIIREVPHAQVSLIHHHLSDFDKTRYFAKHFPLGKIDYLVNVAGSLNKTKQLNKNDIEETFASQVVGHYLLTKGLIENRNLNHHGRVIFVSSGSIYLKQFSLKDVRDPPHHLYRGFYAYANAKRAQLVLVNALSKEFPSFFFAAMHPGWVNTKSTKEVMPWFYWLMKKRLRSVKQGADSIIWLLLTNKNLANGEFWFDRKLAKKHLFKPSGRINKDIKDIMAFLNQFDSSPLDDH